MPLTQHSPSRRKEIAQSLGIDDQYAYQISKGIRTASPALARSWNEIEPSDALWDLRPDDWHRIWPELIDTDGAPQLHAPAETD